MSKEIHNAPLSPYAQPPKKHHRVRWTFIGLVVVGAIAGISANASGGNATHKDSNTKTDQLSNSDAEQNVSITSCAVDPSTHWPTAKVKVTNPTSKNSTYLITVAFESQDGKTQYDTGLATVDSLSHGQTTTDTAQGLKTVTGTLACRITDVQRMAS
jgi:hypothetical protein